MELFNESVLIDKGWWVLFWGWLATIGLAFVFVQVISPVVHHTAATHSDFGEHDEKDDNNDSKQHRSINVERDEY